MDNGHGTSKASKKVNLLRVSTNSAKTYRLEKKNTLHVLRLYVAFTRLILTKDCFFPFRWVRLMLKHLKIQESFGMALTIFRNNQLWSTQKLKLP